MEFKHIHKIWGWLWEEADYLSSVFLFLKTIQVQSMLRFWLCILFAAVCKTTPKHQTGLCRHRHHHTWAEHRWWWKYYKIFYRIESNLYLSWGNGLWHCLFTKLTQKLCLLHHWNSHLTVQAMCWMFWVSPSHLCKMHNRPCLAFKFELAISEKKLCTSICYTEKWRLTQRNLALQSESSYRAQ